MSGSLYRCHRKGRSGCGNLGRDGERVDEYLTELLLMQYEKLAQARVRVEPQEWEAETARLTLHAHRSTAWTRLPPRGRLIRSA